MSACLQLFYLGSTLLKEKEYSYFFRLFIRINYNEDVKVPFQNSYGAWAYCGEEENVPRFSNKCGF